MYHFLSADETVILFSQFPLQFRFSLQLPLYWILIFSTAPFPFLKTSFCLLSAVIFTSSSLSAQIWTPFSTPPIYLSTINFGHHI